MSARARRKIRKTFSLSPVNVSTLERFRKQRRQPSLTASLEAILEEWRIHQEKERLAAETTAYYDSLTPEQQREEAAWGELGLRGMAAALGEHESRS